MMSRRGILLKLGAVISLAAVIYFWEVLADARLISPVFFPSPTRTFAAFMAMEERGDIWWPMANTALRMFYGWVLASLAGVVLERRHRAFGPGAGLSRAAARNSCARCPHRRSFRRRSSFSASTSKMAVTVIAFGALWPVLLGAYHGFRSVSPQLVEMAAAMRMKSVAFLWKVALPSALPDIFAGVRVSLAIALILAVVTEMQAAQTGLGFNILDGAAQLPQS